MHPLVIKSVNLNTISNKQNFNKKTLLSICLFLATTKHHKGEHLGVETNFSHQLINGLINISVKVKVIT